MKKILIFILLLLTVASSKADYFDGRPMNPFNPLLPASVTFYVATTGNDANAGTSISPWRTIRHATQVVTSSGDIISIGAGTFDEGTYVLPIAVGVSIVGSGSNSTFIYSSYAIATTPSSDLTGATFLLNSSSVATNGNQSISGFTLDGGDGSSTAASRAITVRNRSNVIIHDVVIKDFYLGGVAFYNANAWNTTATLKTVEVGNQLYNSTIDNCGDVDATWYGGGLILIAMQQDLLIHDNLLYSNKRSGDHNGNIINAGGTGFRGCKYYNNTSYKPDATYSGWNFHLEFWGNEGGFEIYNNTFIGGALVIDAAGYGYTEMMAGYAFSWSIHDNTFRTNSGAFNTSYNAGGGIHLESRYLGKTFIYNNNFSGSPVFVSLTGYNVHNIYIYDNTISKAKNLFTFSQDKQGSAFYGVVEADNINIYRNKMYVNVGGYGIDGVIYLNITNGQSSSNFNIYNNTIVTDNVAIAKGLWLIVGSGQIATNFKIKNNIFCYMKNVGSIIVANSGTCTGLQIENNLTYNLANANALPVVTGVSSWTNANNLPTSNTTQASPLFVSESTQDYTLQTISSAHNSGQIVTVDGTALPYLGSLPDRGYAEFVESGGTGTTVVLGAVTLTDNGTYPMIDANSTYAPATVTSDGGGIISERGLAWSTSPNPTIANNKQANGAGIGSFSTYVEGLSSNTTYYIRAYCTNEAGTAYSNEVTRTTTLINPIVLGNVIINGLVSGSSRMLSISANAYDDGGGTISSRGICYSLTPNPTTGNSVITNGSGLGDFITVITNLNPSTVYYIRAFSINEIGTAYSPQISFITSTSHPITIGGKTIQLNGKTIQY